jgi:hypothetical protein
MCKEVDKDKFQLVISGNLWLFDAHDVRQSIVEGEKEVSISFSRKNAFCRRRVLRRWWAYRLERAWGWLLALRWALCSMPLLDE